MLKFLRRTPRPAPELDVLDHPVLRAMSLRELADLPFPRPTSRADRDREFLQRFTNAAQRGR